MSSFTCVLVSRIVFKLKTCCESPPFDFWNVYAFVEAESLTQEVPIWLVAATSESSSPRFFKLKRQKDVFTFKDNTKNKQIPFMLFFYNGCVLI